MIYFIKIISNLPQFLSTAVALFVVISSVILSFSSEDEIMHCEHSWEGSDTSCFIIQQSSVTILWKEQYPTVCFIIKRFHHWIKPCSVKKKILYCYTVCFIVQGGSNVFICGSIKQCSVIILLEIYWTVLYCGTTTDLN